MLRLFFFNFYLLGLIGELRCVLGGGWEEG